MKFITSKDTFVKVLGVCQEVINSKSPISILSNVYLEADDNCIIVKCTNSAVSAKTKFTAEVLEKGSTTVFCGKLFAIINQLPDGNIEFETVDKEIQVKSENKKIKYKKINDYSIELKWKDLNDLNLEWVITDFM